MTSIPIIDIAPLIKNTDGKLEVAKQISNACREYGFFYVINHGIDEQLQNRLETLSKQFFALPVEVKNQICMQLGGRAWRGYFPCGDELTSGKPDMKEGIYFGEELKDDHPSVKAGLPMHGANLFPDDNVVPHFKQTVLDYMASVNSLGHHLMRAISLSLGLDEAYFETNYTKEPLQLFRIFNYPPVKRNLQPDEVLWGVGEHTDYGLLTILKQDLSGGLQVKTTDSKWIDAPPIYNSFICNIGDMLDRLTGGLYKSTPHRVKLQTNSDRLSFPFFFDPNFNAQVKKVEGITIAIDDKDVRWDKESVHEFTGTYGQYLLKKVSRVFPQLVSTVL